jgi:hypothetical protein
MLAPVSAQVFPAQTFDFTFSGVSSSNTALILNGIVSTGGGSGDQIVSASGMLSGVSPSTSDGTFSLLGSANDNYYYSSSNYNLEFDVSTGSGFCQTIGTCNDIVVLQSGVNTSWVEPYAGSQYYGTSDLTTSTPAPIPGSGPLSYLAFGLGGLFIKRKPLWRTARMAADKFVWEISRARFGFADSSHVGQWGGRLVFQPSDCPEDCPEKAPRGWPGRARP